MNFKHKMCEQTSTVLSIQKEIETRKPKQPPVQTTPKPPFQQLSMQPPKRTSPIQQPEQTAPQTPQLPPKQRTAPQTPQLPPKQRTAPQTPQLPIQPIIPTTGSTPMQPHEQVQSIQAPIQSTTSVPEKSPTPAPKKAPSSELERKKLGFYRCLDCKIYVLWFQEKAEYICPVCAAEYRIEYVCPDCGSKVTPDATRCPNCGEVLEKEEEEEIKVLCFACETETNWDEKKGISICPECGVECIILRACPICGNELTREAKMCHRCDKVLEEEGKYMYPVCPDHGNTVEYNDEDGFSCPQCKEDPDQEEEENDEDEKDEDDEEDYDDEEMNDDKDE